ncbi:hypothetical protein DKP76_13475 [Falsochrobactrum shanghaiense]|uniref:Uncharacterized protein n=1 Tax=Falsochrobactrum shanghaiense TaxID=2201899 RepID=A0A316JDB5_9HYPH|nr:hypothetical protein [Falsochrobactrum shanghaiense]PWL17043.1 hypothetical protein DKP76_13475 [Falsochrobactrum shanghaiense]
MSNLSQLIEIAEKAIEVNRHEREVRFYSDALGASYDDFKEARGIDRIERGTPEWAEMMEITKPDYIKQEDAKRLARNARRRLETAIRRYEGEDV